MVKRDELQDVYEECEEQYEENEEQDEDEICVMQRECGESKR